VSGCDIFFYDVYIALSVVLGRQVVPVPAKMDMDQLKGEFKEHGAAGGFGFQDFPPGADMKDVVRYCWRLFRFHSLVRAAFDSRYW
jgi:hypothetical protein